PTFSTWTQKSLRINSRNRLLVIEPIGPIQLTTNRLRKLSFYHLYFPLPSSSLFFFFLLIFITVMIYITVSLCSNFVCFSLFLHIFYVALKYSEHSFLFYFLSLTTVYYSATQSFHTTTTHPHTPASSV